VTLITDKSAVASIARNTDDRPTFEYYWLRRLLNAWTSPRDEISSSTYESFRRRVPVRIEPNH
jgi:hypothetical protein